MILNNSNSLLYFFTCLDLIALVSLRILCFSKNGFNFVWIDLGFIDLNYEEDKDDI